jgi:hypothetical protein
MKREGCVQLTPRQQKVVKDAQSALRETLKRAYPEDFPVLFVAAATGLFASLVHGELGSQLMTVINAELKPANLQLARRHGFGAVNHPGPARKV